MKISFAVVLLLFCIRANAQDFKLVPYRTGYKWGFSDKEGVIKIAPKYDRVRPFNNGFSAFKSGDKWGFIDISGKETTAAIFDSVGDYFRGYYVNDKVKQESTVKTGIAVYKNGTERFVNGEGADLLGENDVISKLEIVDDNFGAAERDDVEYIKKGNLTGYRLRSEGFTVEPMYDSLVCIPARLFGEELHFLAEKQGKWGIISKKNEIKLPFEYCGLRPDGMFNNYVIFCRNRKWGIMNNTDYTVAVPPKYDNIKVLRNRYIVTIGKNEGMLTYDFKEAIPVKYRKIESTEDNSGWYLRDASSKIGYINDDGSVSVPAQYPYLKKVTWEEAFTYKRKATDQTVGYMSADGKINIPVKYKDIKPFSNGYAFVVTANGKEGYINESGFEFFKD